MSKIYNMSAGEIRTIHMEDYAENEFLIAELDFLGTNPNAHKIKISEEDEDTRIITITPYGREYEDLCEAVL